MKEQATCEEQRNAWVWVGFFLPLIIYFVLGAISILNDYIMCTCNCPCIQTTHTRECLCPPGYEWNKTFIKLSTFCGSILFYIGDNYFEKVDCNKNAPTISLTLSVAGLLLYRVLPVALRKLKRYCEKEEGKPRSFHLCSPNSNETHSLVIAYTFLLSIVIDFDIVFTAVLNKIDDSKIACNETVQSNIFWGLFVSMISSFVFIQLVITIIFISTQCRHCISRCERLLSKVKLILSTRKTCSLIFFIIWDIFLFFTVPVAVIFYLLADNERVLQCFISIPEDDESQYRIGFLLTSFVVCLLVISGFLIRKWGRCVQIKGKITAVNIPAQEYGQQHAEVNIHEQGDAQEVNTITQEQQGQRLTVQVQNEVGNQMYSFTYNTATKGITSQNCDHAELYRNDIERIIKLPQKIRRTIEVNVDNIENRITVRHHIQEQHHEEVFTINNGEVDIAEGEVDIAEGEGDIAEGGEGDRPEGGEGGEGDRPEGGEGEGDRPEGGEGGEGDRPEGGEGEGDRPEGGEGEGDRAEGGEGGEEEDVAAQVNAAGGCESIRIQDGEDLQERQAEFGEVPLHSPVSNSGAVRSHSHEFGISRQHSLSAASRASEHTFSVLAPPQDSTTGGPRSRSPSPDIRNDQGDDTEKTSLLHVDSTKF